MCDCPRPKKIQPAMMLSNLGESIDWALKFIRMCSNLQASFRKLILVCREVFWENEYQSCWKSTGNFPCIVWCLRSLLAAKLSLSQWKAFKLPNAEKPSTASWRVQVQVDVRLPRCCVKWEFDHGVEAQIEYGNKTWEKSDVAITPTMQGRASKIHVTRHDLVTDC